MFSNHLLVRQRKRKHQDAEEEDDSTLVKKIKPSQRTAEENRSLFDDDNDSDVEFLEEFMRTEKKRVQRF